MGISDKSLDLLKEITDRMSKFGVDVEETFHFGQLEKEAKKISQDKILNLLSEGDKIYDELTSTIPDIEKIYSDMTKSLVAKPESIEKTTTSNDKQEPTYNRNKHQENLKNLGRKLTTIRCHEERDHSYTLKVVRNPEPNRPIQTIDDLSELFEEPELEIGWENVNDLDYLDKLVSHLHCNEYQNIEKSWQELSRLITKHNESVNKLNNDLNNLIRTKLSDNYVGFVGANDSGGSDQNYYYNRNIYKLLWYALMNESETLNKSNFELYSEQYGYPIRFNIVTRKQHLHTTDHVLISAVRQQDADMEKLKSVLISMRETSGVLQFSQLRIMRNEVNDVRNQFRSGMEHIERELNDGVLIKGTCTTCH